MMTMTTIRTNEQGHARGLLACAATSMSLSLGGVMQSARGAVATPPAAPGVSMALKDGLEALHPNWFDDFARADADLAAGCELASLVESAPHPFLAGMAYGKLTMRIEIAAITGRRSEEPVPISVHHEMSRSLERLEGLFPEWFDDFSRVDADFAARDEMLALMKSAPHPLLSGLLYGKLAMRIELRAITGR